MPIKVEKGGASAPAAQESTGSDAGTQGGGQNAQSASRGAGSDAGAESSRDSQPSSTSAGEAAGASAARAPAPAAAAPAAAQGTRERAPEPARLRMHDAVQQLAREMTGDYASQAALENVAVALATARYVIANNVLHAKGAAREMLETLKRVI